MFSLIVGKSKELKIRHFSPFYRRYIPGALVSLISLDQRGAFSPEYCFFYNRIPKVANSTIVHYLVEGMGLGLYKDRNYKSILNKPSMLSRDDVLDIHNYFKFVFFRDPRTRVLSAYKDKVVRRGYLSKGGKIRSSPFKLNSNPPSFDEFLDYLEEGGLYDNAHWAPQSDLLLLPIKEYDFLGRFECLKKDLDFVMDRIFSHAAPDKLIVKGPPPTGSSEGDFLNLDANQVVRIEKIYRKDVELFKSIGFYNFGE